MEDVQVPAERNRANSRGEAPEPLSQRYTRVRSASEGLARRLSPEDAGVQSMTEASPTKWHLAHTSWFFETFVLVHEPGFEPFHPRYSYLFNSYYNAVGERHARPERGLLTRPALGEVLRYRAFVDDQMRGLFERRAGEALDPLRPVIEVGLNHEQQHQELILTDILHAFSRNPLRPAYAEVASVTAGLADRGRRDDWVGVEGGLHPIGHSGETFAFDNEGPRHKVYLEPFEIGARLVTNREFLAFIEAGGYREPSYWLSEGWDRIAREGWRAPLYWERVDGEWTQFTLRGRRPLDLLAPVCHVSFFEADAYATWAGARLPTESEWEVAASRLDVRPAWAGGAPAADGNFVESGHLRPVPIETESTADGPAQMFGDVWEWTASPYRPYPGYRPPEGALGEYNGKFMCNQFVLRGGSCATPRSHIRPTYRNFFHPQARWQFSGIRLARDLPR